MLYPNLKAVLFQRHITGYELAAVIKVNEVGFSRRMTGRVQFTPLERARIAAYFGLAEEWLFAPLNIPNSARYENAMAKFPALETR
jgi:plasmid maintenance system antidote protein VapI